MPPTSDPHRARGARTLLCAALAACHPPPATTEVIAPPALGIDVTIFASATPGKGYALVDDRREVTVAHGALVLPDLAPDIALDALALEPLDALAIGACARDPETAAVTCAARGAAGTHHVRLVYPAPALAASAQTDLAMPTPATATVTTTYAIPTPAWQRTGTLAIVDADAPHAPPPVLARGEVAFDGSTAILATPPRTLPARIRRIYTTARKATDDVGDTSPTGGGVWAWLELGDARDHALPHAPIFARILDGDDARALDIPAAGPIAGAAATRIPLFADPALRGKRVVSAVTGYTDRLTVSLANTSDVAREVVVEEPLRDLPNPRNGGTAALPAPQIGKRVARLVRTVPPNAIDRFQFVVTYTPRAPATASPE